MDYTVIIPARMASSRLPDKPLADIAGLPMVVRVAQRAARSQARRVVVAADDTRVVQACQAHGIEALLTRQDHVSGSDRLAEACALLGLPDDALLVNVAPRKFAGWHPELLVNVQGDEPLIPPALIDEVARVLAERPEASMGTAAHAIHDLSEFTNPNVVKVVMDARQLALYFSRAPIPWWRDGQQDGHFKGLPSPAPLRHIGIYSYRAGYLRKFPQLPTAPIEALESLEQLRALWHGHRIAVHVSADSPGMGVDTPADLERVRSILGTPAA